jgi:hypothetical protein
MALTSIAKSPGLLHGITTSKSFQKIMRKIQPAIELMDRSTIAVQKQSVPLLELIERFQSWEPTKPVDKGYSVLSFSTDARDAPELRLGYTIFSYTLVRKVIQFSFPDAIIETRVGTTETVTFWVDGFILGEISQSMTDCDKRTWTFSTPELSAASTPEEMTVNPPASRFFRSLGR